MELLIGGASDQQAHEPKFDLKSIGKLYDHKFNHIDETEPCLSKSKLSFSQVNDGILGSVFNLLPSVKNFFTNQEEIAQYPLDFVESKRYSTSLKVFQTTLGTTVNGVAETLFYTVKLVTIVVTGIFLTLQALIYLDSRKMLGNDMKITLKKEVSYYLNGLIKGVLQIVPGAGIFLPTLYNTAKNNLVTKFAKSISKVATFLKDQQEITTDNVSFIKSDATNLKKAASYVIGSTISGVINTLFNLANLVTCVVKSVFDVTIGMIFEIFKQSIDFIMGDSEYEDELFERLHAVQNDLKAVATNTNQIVRNVIRAVPIVGHFLGEAFDKVELSIIDGIEVAAHKIKSAISFIFPAYNTENEELEEVE